jgi:hypothetical protein
VVFIGDTRLFVAVTMVVRFSGGVLQKVEELVNVVTLRRHTIEDRSQSFSIVFVFTVGLFSWLKMKSSK